MRAQAIDLPAPAGRILHAVIERDRAYLARLLEPLVDELSADPALSPERSPATSAPVFLLHGVDDNVIPSSETPLVGRYLQAQGHTNVEWLLTPLLLHARLMPPSSTADAWRLISFWRGVFGVLD